MPVDEILADSITGMTGLQERPIYFLKLNNSATPNLVVKGDNPRMSENAPRDVDAEVSIKWGSKLMKNVQNPLVNNKIMTTAEIQVFKQYVLAHFPQGSKQYNNATGVVGTDHITYTWVKMPYVADVTTTDFLDDNQNAIPKVIYQNIQQFSKDAVWTDLGKVVAVDIFNGNNDRFGLRNGMWSNYSNIMFVANGPTSVIGLDMWDPNGSKGNQVVSNLNTGGGFEELNILIDPAKRDRFATQCVTSVGTVLKRELGGGSGKNGGPMFIDVQLVGGPGGVQRKRIAIAKLDAAFMHFKDTFSRGIDAGATALKQYLQGKVREYRNPNREFPRGVMLRIEYLGWVPQPARPLAALPQPLGPLPQLAGQGAPVRQFQRATPRK